MPLVHVHFKNSRSPSFRKGVGDSIQRALIESINVPPNDRFQIFASNADDLIYDDQYLGIQRTDGIIIVQIHLAKGRTVDQKKALYKRIAELLVSEQGVRPEDVFINLVEVSREDWSFGNGIAQYADSPPAHLTKMAAGQPPQ
jgi:phenylpyruvate tautomerase PptA (4-oxalocrotonate tautomerase family)